ncbi:T cell receptor alpha variable 22 [Rhinolophus ferrumequinum]|nr:T cell receptor alpha variable 22 [Rhinolophus ferrumequinum]
MPRAAKRRIMKRLLGTVLALLCTPICCVRGVQVEQSPTALSLQEGASSTLRCKFSNSVNNVQWFRQNPGGGLINLFYIPSGTKVNGRLTAKTDPKERNSSLHISSSQTTDSAIYFCAVGATVFPRHLQPVHKPSAGLSSSSNHNHMTKSPHSPCTA